ncbi:peptidase domain-containing ABC transporter [Acinetobacter baumannii]|nr:peptidase domain-containing ABC transporter [Acinetobacter baumannii]
MEKFENLTFSLKRKVPIILQAEASECGLACIAMILGYYGHNTNLFDLRQKFLISSRGTRLTTLISIAEKSNLTTRPIRLDLENLDKLHTPCILHWDLNHFVILEKVKGNKITIIDPAFGSKKLTLNDVSNNFTGIALELWINTNFVKRKKSKNISLLKIFSNVSGIWRTVMQIFTLSIALELFILLTPFFMQWVIDYAIVSADQNLLITLAISFSVLTIINELIKLLQQWILMYTTTMLKVQSKTNIFNHLTKLPSNFFIRRHLGDVMARFNSIDIIQNTLTTSFVTSILDGLMTFFTLILMFIYSPKLTFIVISLSFVYFTLKIALYTPLRQASEEQISHAAKKNTHFMETIRGIKTIQLFNKQDQRQKTWLTIFINEINSSLKSQKLNLTFNFINGLLFKIGNIIIIFIGATIVINGNFTVGFLIAFLAYKEQFTTRFISLIDNYIQLRMLGLHGDMLADILFTDEKNTMSLNKLNKETYIENTYDISVKDVSFRYSPDDPWIINNLNFNIKSGESVALIGESGCGKSTLLNLLIGNLIPEQGEIKIGGNKIKDIDNNTLSALISVVSQDDTLFAGSILENIIFFDYDYDYEWVKECAKMAALHTDIILMPMGYNTLVGDMGNILSGGQKQRLLIARALYRKPKIIFLDEATSHLDITKEKEINETIRRLNITRIIIAHRLETINSADRVIEVKKLSE